MFRDTTEQENLMRIERMLVISALFAALLFGVACSEPGSAEKAGKKIDETVEKIKHGDEGPLEKAGRKMDESLQKKEKKSE
jgi:hypothetical protein